MNIKYQPWRIRPYRVQWDALYDLHHTQAGGGPLLGEPLQGPFWVLRADVQHWLHELAPARFCGLSIEPVSYQYSTGRLPFTPMASGGKLVQVVPLSPPLYFARKSDVLMLKLAFGGKL